MDYTSSPDVSPGLSSFGASTGTSHAIKRMPRHSHSGSMQQPPNRAYDCKAAPVGSPFKAAVVSDKNARRRRKMEDGHAYFYDFGGLSGFGYFAILDGHAGSSASLWCQDHLHEVLLRRLKSRSADEGRKSIQEILSDTFQEADSQLTGQNEIYSGCTAVVCYFKPKGAKGHGRVYTANAGDARAVLFRDRKAVRLSYDHKGSDRKEVARVKEAGGFVANERVNGILAVTRALGDEEMKEYVTGKPYTTKVHTGPSDAFLILACDGLWDVCSDQDACEMIENEMDPLKASELLVNYAMDNGSTDNLSVMVVRFMGP